EAFRSDSAAGPRRRRSGIPPRCRSSAAGRPSASSRGSRSRRTDLLEDRIRIGEPAEGRRGRSTVEPTPSLIEVALCEVDRRTAEPGALEFEVRQGSEVKLNASAAALEHHAPVGKRVPGPRCLTPHAPEARPEEESAKEDEREQPRDDDRASACPASPSGEDRGHEEEGREQREEE